jgi:glycosyltransferase involved in cell wall biosynthesis
VSVVVPVFDEEHGLRAVLDALRAALQAAGRDHEIVVVDDGSTDATAQILSGCTDITVIRHPENRGYGAALKSGIRAARHPLVAVIDADGTYPVAALAGLVDRCTTADMVVGARTGKHVQAAPARNVVKWCFRQFAQWTTGASIPDLNSGLRVFKRDLAERFMALFPDGFSFTTTITVASMAERLVVRFEPVDYMPRIGKSKVRPLRDTFRIARQVLWLGWRAAPLRTLAAVLCPLLAIGIVSSAYHLAALGHVTRGDVAACVGYAVGLAVGLWAERRARRRRWSDMRAFA